MKKVIYCLQCGHIRYVTKSWIKNLNISGLTITNISSFKKRFKCTKCLSKSVIIKVDYELLKIKAKLNRKKLEIILKKPFVKGELNIFNYHKSFLLEKKEIKVFSIIDSALLKMIKNESLPQEPPHASFWRKKTCKVCGGDGGMGGGCYNCEGTGWVDEF